MLTTLEWRAAGHRAKESERMKLKLNVRENILTDLSGYRAVTTMVTSTDALSLETCKLVGMEKLGNAVKGRVAFFSTLVVNASVEKLTETFLLLPVFVKLIFSYFPTI